MKNQEPLLVRAAEYKSEYAVHENGIVKIDAFDKIFDIGGIIHPSENGNQFFRLRYADKERYSELNRMLAYNTSGVQVRIGTTASEVTVGITLDGNGNGFHHFTDRAVYGADFTIGIGKRRKYVGGQMVTFAISTEYNEGKLDLGAGYKEFTINLPLYGGVKAVSVSFPEDSYIAHPAERAIKPVCFYGSSITQGACSGRPGTMYPNIVCRALDSDCMCLGFSGSAMGEQVVAEYIASREISAFVMDYDYNTPTVESLRETHEPFYRTVRNAHPDIPIVIVSHPYYHEATENDRARVAVVKETFDRARANGENVAFVDSESFFPMEMRDLFTVDNLHPNDTGNYFMAKRILAELSPML